MIIRLFRRAPAELYCSRRCSCRYRLDCQAISVDTCRVVPQKRQVSSLSPRVVRGACQTVPHFEAESRHCPRGQDFAKNGVVEYLAGVPLDSFHTFLVGLSGTVHDP